MTPIRQPVVAMLEAGATRTDTQGSPEAESGPGFGQVLARTRAAEGPGSAQRPGSPRRAGADATGGGADAPAPGAPSSDDPKRAATDRSSPRGRDDRAVGPDDGGAADPGPGAGHVDRAGTGPDGDRTRGVRRAHSKLSKDERVDSLPPIAGAAAGPAPAPVAAAGEGPARPDVGPDGADPARPAAAAGRAKTRPAGTSTTSTREPGKPAPPDTGFGTAPAEAGGPNHAPAGAVAGDAKQSASGDDAPADVPTADTRKRAAATAASGSGPAATPDATRDATPDAGAATQAQADSAPPGSEIQTTPGRRGWAGAGVTPRPVDNPGGEAKSHRTVQDSRHAAAARDATRTDPPPPAATTIATVDQHVDPGDRLALGRDDRVEPSGDRGRDAGSLGALAGPSSAAADPGGVRAPQLTVPVPVNAPGFPKAFAEQVGVAIRVDLSQADLVLTPDDLGPVRVELNLDGHNATIHFSALHAETRQAIEHSIGHLREMLASQGLALADAQVGSGFRRAPQDGGSGTVWPVGPADERGLPATDGVIRPTGGAGRSNALVDLFA